ncbi:MAG: leucine--tRNA ligase [Gammaproteobacteria bacterium]|nr:leucine--tRNA ligase [Gammaproteobacteria bacterium]MDH4256143.1 leucine--tRNA ligase [Gammaproteobacteria bacterium]MDH5310834.1 leucine--tRNA ligase [Gammaproteobacteria bacterium]
MTKRYDPAKVERKAQQYWDGERCFEAREDPDRDKFYCLSMFPYPSGKCHMGHVRNYTIGDVVSRYQRMLGKNVLQPMGWDAFGLPAENAAIKNKVPPAKWTYANIDNMRRQLQRLGYAYDWSKEIATCRPEYYRWEQQMFVRLFREGLVYRKDSEVNWDPVDQTVLANEQVVDGRGWRSGAVVERRKIPQWFLKITAYADELLDNLDLMDGWPDAVKTMQRNWIGRSRGLEIRFEVPGHEALSVFTTRPDTLFGVTYMAVAPEHPLAELAAKTNPKLATFIGECKQLQVAEAAMETAEKKGMPLGIEARHPATGDPVPVWVANFVLMSYGTGAVMAVPGHDDRDWEFATRYGLPIRQVIRPADGSGIDIGKGAYTDYGLLVNSGPYDGMDFSQAFAAIKEATGSTERINYRLRDWGVSRQRYWGCPIPVIYCSDCGAVPVPEQDLPVVLPEDVAFSGVTSPLRDMPEFVDADCPGCGQPAKRETDTFDTFVESSWYYARFTSRDQDSAILDDRANYWLPVDQYIGGIEHAVMHLLYFRFWHKLMRDAGLVGSDEPATRLLCQGMVVAETWYREEKDGSTTYFNPVDLDIQRDSGGRVTGAILRSDGKPVTMGRVEKMSKSKNNGVDPEQMMDRYGADTVRLFMMSAAPPEQSLEWSEEGVQGAFRFLKRLWAAVGAHVAAGEVEPVRSYDEAQLELRRKTHQTIAKVSDDVGRRYKFNTAVAATMELLNAVSRLEDQSAGGRAAVHEALESIVLLLSPIVPHICHELWYQLGHTTNIIDERWPAVDEAALEQDTIELVVQVNGKLRGRVRVAVDAPKATIEELALADANVQRFVADQQIRKIIVVPGRLVNVVV